MCSPRHSLSSTLVHTTPAGSWLWVEDGFVCVFRELKLSLETTLTVLQLQRFPEEGRYPCTLGTFLYRVVVVLGLFLCSEGLYCRFSSSLVSGSNESSWQGPPLVVSPSVSLPSRSMSSEVERRSSRSRSPCQRRVGWSFAFLGFFSVKSQ